jgi:hypothetical protein
MPFDAEIEPVSRETLILQRARDMLAKGWCKGAARRIGQDGHAQRCAAQAVHDAALGMSTSTFPTPFPMPGTDHFFNVLSPAFDCGNQFMDAMARLGFHGTAELANWNDDPRTTLADVLDRFDRAIAARF